MRCLTLAEALKKKSVSSIFISRKHIGNLNHLIIKKGFEVVELPIIDKIKQNNLATCSDNSDYINWLGSNEDQDAMETIKIIRNYGRRWVAI